MPIKSGIEQRGSCSPVRKRSRQLAVRLSLALLLVHAGAPGFTLAAAECCQSIAPRFPPATAYGATMFRPDDLRNDYSPHVPLPLQVPNWVAELQQQPDITRFHFGPYSTALVPEIVAAGALHLEEGNYARAEAAYSRAVHLLRVNWGLATPLQIPLIEQQIEALLGQGKLLEADKKQDYLFRLYRENMAAAQRLPCRAGQGSLSTHPDYVGPVHGDGR